MSPKNLQAIRTCALHLSKWNDAFSCSDLEAPQAGQPSLRTSVTSGEEKRNLSVSGKKRDGPANDQPADVPSSGQRRVGALPYSEETDDEDSSQSTHQHTESSSSVLPTSSPPEELLLPPWDDNLPAPSFGYSSAPRQMHGTERTSEEKALDDPNRKQAGAPAELSNETPGKRPEGARQRSHSPRFRNDNSQAFSPVSGQENVDKTPPSDLAIPSRSQTKNDEQPVTETGESPIDSEPVRTMSLPEIENNSTNGVLPVDKERSLGHKKQTAVEEASSGSTNASLRRPSNAVDVSPESNAARATILRSDAAEKLSPLAGVDQLTGSSEVTVISVWCSVFASLLLLLGCFLCIRFPVVCGSVLSRRDSLWQALVRRAKRSPGPCKQTEGIPRDGIKQAGRNEAGGDKRHSFYHGNQGITGITSAQQLTKRADQSRRLFFFSKHAISRNSRRNTTAANTSSSETAVTRTSSYESADSFRATGGQQTQETFCTSAGWQGHTKKSSPGGGDSVSRGGPTHSTVINKQASHSCRRLVGDRIEHCAQGSLTPSLFHPPKGDLDAGENFSVSLSLGSHSSGNVGNLAATDRKKRETPCIFGDGASTRGRGRQEWRGNPSERSPPANKGAGTASGAEHQPPRDEPVEPRSDSLLEHR